MAKGKKRRGAKKNCKCGPVRGTNKCRKVIKKGKRKGQCPKRPRKRRRGRK